MDDSFTIVAIGGLKSDHVEFLRKDGGMEDLKIRIANTFHFHMHPSDLNLFMKTDQSHRPGSYLAEKKEDDAVYHISLHKVEYSEPGTTGASSPSGPRVWRQQSSIKAQFSVETDDDICDVVVINLKQEDIRSIDELVQLVYNKMKKDNLLRHPGPPSDFCIVYDSEKHRDISLSTEVDNDFIQTYFFREDVSPRYVFRRNVVSNTLDFTPSTDILASKNAFKGIEDALAELIGNSIQYCFPKIMEGVKPTIGIYFFTPPPSQLGDSFLVVTDNGLGMDREGLVAFGRPAWSKAKRGEHNTSRAHRDPSKFTEVDALGGEACYFADHEIGMYGVGAKKAAFWLGEDLHVITKKPGEALLDTKILKKNLNHKNLSAAWKNHPFEQQCSYTEAESKCAPLVSMVTSIIDGSRKPGCMNIGERLKVHAIDAKANIPLCLSRCSQDIFKFKICWDEDKLVFGALMYFPTTGEEGNGDDFLDTVLDNFTTVHWAHMKVPENALAAQFYKGILPTKRVDANVSRVRAVLFFPSCFTIYENKQKLIFGNIGLEEAFKSRVGLGAASQGLGRNNSLHANNTRTNSTKWSKNMGRNRNDIARNWLQYNSLVHDLNFIVDRYTWERSSNSNTVLVVQAKEVGLPSEKINVGDLIFLCNDKRRKNVVKIKHDVLSREEYISRGNLARGATSSRRSIVNGFYVRVKSITADVRILDGKNDYEALMDGKPIGPLKIEKNMCSIEVEMPKEYHVLGYKLPQTVWYLSDLITNMKNGHKNLDGCNASDIVSALIVGETPDAEAAILCTENSNPHTLEVFETQSVRDPQGEGKSAFHYYLNTHRKKLQMVRVLDKSGTDITKRISQTKTAQLMLQYRSFTPSEVGPIIAVDPNPALIPMNFNQGYEGIKTSAGTFEKQFSIVFCNQDLKDAYKRYFDNLDNPDARSRAFEIIEQLRQALNPYTLNTLVTETYSHDPERTYAMEGVHIKETTAIRLGDEFELKYDCVDENMNKVPNASNLDINFVDKTGNFTLEILAKTCVAGSVVAQCKIVPKRRASSSVTIEKLIELFASWKDHKGSVKQTSVTFTVLPGLLDSLEYNGVPVQLNNTTNQTVFEIGMKDKYGNFTNYSPTLWEFEIHGASAQSYKCVLEQGESSVKIKLTLKPLFWRLMACKHKKYDFELHDDKGHTLVVELLVANFLEPAELVFCDKDSGEAIGQGIVDKVSASKADKRDFPFSLKFRKGEKLCSDDDVKHYLSYKRCYYRVHEKAFQEGASDTESDESELDDSSDSSDSDESIDRQTSSHIEFKPFHYKSLPRLCMGSKACVMCVTVKVDFNSNFSSNQPPLRRSFYVEVLPDTNGAVWHILKKKKLKDLRLNGEIKSLVESLEYSDQFQNPIDLTSLKAQPTISLHPDCFSFFDTAGSSNASVLAVHPSCTNKYEITAKLCGSFRAGMKDKEKLYLVINNTEPQLIGYATKGKPSKICFFEGQTEVEEKDVESAFVVDNLSAQVYDEDGNVLNQASGIELKAKENMKILRSPNASNDKLDITLSGQDTMGKTLVCRAYHASTKRKLLGQFKLTLTIPTAKLVSINAFKKKTSFKATDKFPPLEFKLKTEDGSWPKHITRLQCNLKIEYAAGREGEFAVLTKSGLYQSTWFTEANTVQFNHVKPENADDNLFCFKKVGKYRMTLTLPITEDDSTKTLTDNVEMSVSTGKTKYFQFQSETELKPIVQTSNTGASESIFTCNGKAHMYMFDQFNNREKVRRKLYMKAVPCEAPPDQMVAAALCKSNKGVLALTSTAQGYQISDLKLNFFSPSNISTFHFGEYQISISLTNNANREFINYGPHSGDVVNVVAHATEEMLNLQTRINESEKSRNLLEEEIRDLQDEIKRVEGLNLYNEQKVSAFIESLESTVFNVDDVRYGRLDAIKALVDKSQAKLNEFDSNKMYNILKSDGTEFVPYARMCQNHEILSGIKVWSDVDRVAVSTVLGRNLLADIHRVKKTVPDPSSSVPVIWAYDTSNRNMEQAFRETVPANFVRAFERVKFNRTSEETIKTIMFHLLKDVLITNSLEAGTKYQMAQAKKGKMNEDVLVVEIADRDGDQSININGKRFIATLLTKGGECRRLSPPPFIVRSPAPREVMQSDSADGDEIMKSYRACDNVVQKSREVLEIASARHELPNYDTTNQDRLANLEVDLNDLSERIKAMKEEYKGLKENRKRQRSDGAGAGQEHSVSSTVLPKRKKTKKITI